MVALDLQTFHQSREGGNVTGVIYVELEAGAFPGNEWSDFPVIVLGWWAGALFELEVPARREVLWRFMDGPHALRLTKVEQAPSSDGVTLARIKRSLLEAAEQVVSYCTQHDMHSKDLEILRTNLGRLKVNLGTQSTSPGRTAHVEIRPALMGALRR